MVVNFARLSLYMPCGSEHMLLNVLSLIFNAIIWLVSGAKKFIDIDDSSKKYANLLPFIR
jgi:hypothetical protein